MLGFSITSDFSHSMGVLGQPEGVARTFDFGGHAVASVTARPGSLHALASAFAQSTPDSYGTADGFGSTVSNTLPGLATARSGAYFADGVEFFNPSLPVGAPVNVFGTVTLDDAVTSNAGVNTGAKVQMDFFLDAVSRQGNRVGVPTRFTQYRMTDTSEGGVLTAAPSHTATFTLGLQNGDVLYFSQMLEVSARAYSFPGAPLGTAVADASNTAYVIFGSDPGVGLTSASGYDYTLPPPPLPEPSVACVVVAGAVGLAGRRARGAVTRRSWN
jgi:hypothetical protein